jgi:C_GCAxxG_C_C family probable redox protein
MDLNMAHEHRITPEKKKIEERINQMMDEGFGCAESLVTAVGEHLWEDVDDKIKMTSTGFSGGVGGSHEELCGGVSGAAILMGLLYGRTTNEEAKMVRCKRLISEHRDLFIQEFGTTNCQQLRDAEYGADERNPCSALIVPAAFMLLDILEAEDERERLPEEGSEKAGRDDVLSIEQFIEEYSRLGAGQLVEILNQEDLAHAHRDWVGDQLEELGDPRHGVGLDSDLLPDLLLLPYPSGEIEIERAGLFHVEEGFVAKYPITARQYQVFLDAPDGFSNPIWWEGIGVDPMQLPIPGEQRFSGGNYPRDNVSWFDAVAFCRWLTGKLRPNRVSGQSQWGEKIRERDWEIRLPLEWEWQMAATGGDQDFTFPWGPDWIDSRAHTKHNQLNKSMSVGMYPAGASPVGALEMSGNIWEWCLNCYEDPGELDLLRNDRRVLRGGSWYHWGSYAHTDMRSRYYPDHRYNAGGFRVVCAHPIR